MYSGQEIVSQERCRLVLAVFYEGINCIDYKSVDTENPVLSLTLQDAQTAVYDADTLTLTTVNFSVRPLLIAAETDFSYLFAAELPEGTTGLEVIMFAEEYQKVRIMPLYLVRTCNSYNWSWDLPPGGGGDLDPFDWSYIKSVCSNDNETVINYQGTIDTIDRYEMTFAGNTYIDPTLIHLFFHDGKVPFIDMVHETWIDQIPVIDQYGVTIKYLEQPMGRITLPLDADEIEILGAYETRYAIRPCEFLHDNRVFRNLEFCYDSETQHTKLVFPTSLMTQDLEPDEDGWYYVGDLRVRPVL